MIYRGYIVMAIIGCSCYSSPVSQELIDAEMSYLAQTNILGVWDPQEIPTFAKLVEIEKRRIQHESKGAIRLEGQVLFSQTEPIDSSTTVFNIDYGVIAVALDTIYKPGTDIQVWPDYLVLTDKAQAAKIESIRMIPAGDTLYLRFKKNFVFNANTGRWTVQ